MRSKLRKLAFALVLSLAFVFTASAAEVKYPTTVKELETSYESSTYIIGSTRFDDKIVVTEEASEEAVANEIDLNDVVTTPDEVSTYYRSSIDGAWYKVVTEETDTALEPVKGEALTELTENLNIYYVNNEVKLLGFSYNGDVAEIVDAETNNVVFETNKFIVPATVKNFDFKTSTGDVIKVETENIVPAEGTENGYLTFVKTPTLTHSIPTTIEALTQATDYSVTLSKNDYVDKTLVVTATITDENGNTVATEVKDENGYLFVCMPKYDKLGKYTVKLTVKEAGMEEVLYTTTHEFEVVYTEKPNLVDQVNTKSAYLSNSIYNKLTAGNIYVTPEVNKNGFNSYYIENNMIHDLTAEQMENYYVEVANYVGEANPTSLMIEGNERAYTNNQISSLSVGNNAFIFAPIWKIENNKLYIATTWLAADAMPKGTTKITVGGQVIETTIYGVELENGITLSETATVSNPAVSTATVEGTTVKFTTTNTQSTIGITLKYTENGVEKVIDDNTKVIFRKDLTTDAMGLTRVEGNGVTYAVYPFNYSTGTITEDTVEHKEDHFKLAVPGIGTIDDLAIISDAVVTLPAAE